MAKDELHLIELFPELDLIQDSALRHAVEQTWIQLWEQSTYEHLNDVPTSTKIPYPQILHCQGIVKGALALASVWQEVHGTVLDQDVLIAAAMLMDVSKLVETVRDADGTIRASEIGQTFPHAVYGAHIALNLGVPLPVVHVMVAHSPNGGKSPGTPEAHLLDWVDQADISGFGFTIWTRRVLHYQP
jgi:hypothetical protein